MDAVKLGIAWSIIGFSLLAMVVLFIWGLIVDTRGMLTLIGAVGSLAAVLWAAWTIGELG
jgi:hypothetical protein